MSKLNRSNKAHERLSDHYNNVANNNRVETPKNFWALVKRDYHDEVNRTQKRTGRLLDKSAKKHLYNQCAYSLADYRDEVNMNYGYSRYIPKKYLNLLKEKYKR